MSTPFSSTARDEAVIAAPENSPMETVSPWTCLPSQPLPKLSLGTVCQHRLSPSSVGSKGGQELPFFPQR